MTVPRQARFPHDLAGLNRLFETIHLADGHRPIGEHLFLELNAGQLAEMPGLVMEHDSQIVGFFGLTGGFQPGWWTGELAVHPAWRTQEVFRSLLEAALAEVAQERGAGLRLWTFLPHLGEAALARGFRTERELRSLILDLPQPLEPRYPVQVEVGRFLPGRDEYELLSVNNEAFAAHPENGNWTPGVLGRRMQQSWFGAEHVIVARLHGRMVGFCWTKQEDADVGEIYVLAVAPAHQRQGLGRALLVDGLSHLSRTRAKSAVLYVDSGNHQATHLYESIGFRLDHVDRSFVKSL
jgi:mycothiol synthase